MSLLADARATLMPGFRGTELPAWMSALLADGLVSCCLYGENVVDPAQLRTLTDAVRAVRADAIVALDEEGGDVTRVHYATGSPFPGAAVLGRADDIGWTRSVGERVGQHVRAIGGTMTFGPVADVNVDPDNPVIGVRSAGADAALAARHVAAWIEGAQRTGVAASAKHFPGHGDTAVDSHVGLPVVHADLETLRGRELAPFRAAVDAGVASIMTSHIVVPALDSEPATHSRVILTELLRGELGFEGVIVSDALDMAGASGTIGIPEAAVRALAAGCDLLCLGTATGAEGIAAIERAVLAAVDDGRLDAERVRDAALRTRALAAGGPAPMPLTAIGDATDDDLARIRSTFLVRERAHRWLASPPAAPAVVRLERAANIAAGAVPWDPFAGSLVVEPGAVPRLPAGPVIVLGKDLERGPEAAVTIAALREWHEVLVVDMGWSRGELADIATFGASRACGLALRGMLAR
ncbi:glycoside hydrolase family 3 N-terminal domain-containing protein [Agrococcus baldri]|uniref:Sugar hydrolase n=1 Tax=Agrococcus baldri TaxID=153730 RepID=A0AA87RID7_9MICO|nr:glycoside hydrolase family 3 N-terminal domain-containing protein [Agrococcus baldri]GEK79923.1 sugar hydrolase [Agrococcus baldri]